MLLWLLLLLYQVSIKGIELLNQISNIWEIRHGENLRIIVLKETLDLLIPINHSSNDKFFLMIFRKTSVFNLFIDLGEEPLTFGLGTTVSDGTIGGEVAC